MSYTIDRLITGAAFDAVDSRTRVALAANGFGVLTEIDGTATMKKKIDVDMPAYRIRGACNPQMAWQAIDNKALHAVAGQVRDLLTRAVAAI